MFEAGSKYSNYYMENGAIVWGAVNYFFNREAAKTRATVFYAEPDLKVAFRVKFQNNKLINFQRCVSFYLLKEFLYRIICQFK
jgi:hypothetical protein